MTSNTPNKITDIDDKIKLLEELRDIYWQSFRWMLARNKPAAAELWHTKSRTVDEAAIAILQGEEPEETYVPEEFKQYKYGE